MASLLRELAQGISFLLSVCSLFALLYRSIFAYPGSHWRERLPGALEALAIAAAACFASGLVFILTTQSNPATQNTAAPAGPPSVQPIGRTLPAQLFLWTVAIALVLFVVSSYLEEHYVPLMWRNQPRELSAWTLLLS